MAPEVAGRILVSVLVPTYNRCALLRELVESLWAQTLDRSSYEIIVIDDCSTDGSWEMLCEMQPRAPMRMICRRTPSNQGPIVARNMAAGLAQGAIYAFTDSDCRVSPEWLERGLAAFRRRPEAGFVSGAVLDKPEQPTRFFSLPNGTKISENPVYPTWNIFYRREVFRDLGGFDETAWFGNVNGRPIDCSDSDFALKVKYLGYPYVFAPDVIVYHEVWQASPLGWLKAFFRLVYVPALIKRHPRLRGEILWWGPFLMKENLLFYAVVAGAAAAAAGWPWAAALALPHFAYLLRQPGLRLSLPGLPRLAGQLVFLTLRQAVICGSLLYGSIRMRTLVL